MKKILAVICAVALLFALCVPVLSVCAAQSPSGKPKYDVTVKADDATKGKVEKEVLENGDVKATAKPNEGEKFFGWTIKGDKYTIVSGTVSSEEIVIRAESDIELVAKFANAGTPGGSDSPTAPDTNDVGFAGAVAAFVALVACAVVFKKRAFN